MPPRPGQRSSVDKGEPFPRPSRPSAYDPAAIVIVIPRSARQHAADCHASIINAGDGMHQHPSQALLDVLTSATASAASRRESDRR
jgi:aspartate carbamoyltransferase catalytic subunit